MKLVTIAVEKTLIEDLTETDSGIVLDLDGGSLYLFMSGGQIGLYSKRTVRKVDGNFSEIPTTEITAKLNPSILEENNAIH